MLFRSLREIRTAALWRQHELLRFLDHAGYRLGGSHVLDCALHDAELGSSRERPVDLTAQHADPNDYGSPSTQDFESLARDAAEVRLLTQADLEGIARIDRRITGRDRRGYLCRAFEESLAASALRISLGAWVDRSIGGFLMARLDYGDFGRAEPVAVIDTIGVDPRSEERRVGKECRL